MARNLDLRPVYFNHPLRFFEKKAITPAHHAREFIFHIDIPIQEKNIRDEQKSEARLFGSESGTA